MCVTSSWHTGFKWLELARTGLAFVEPLLKTSMCGRGYWRRYMGKLCVGEVRGELVCIGVFARVFLQESVSRRVFAKAFVHDQLRGQLAYNSLIWLD